MKEQALVIARLIANGDSFKKSVMRSSDPEWRYMVAIHGGESLISKLSEKQQEDYTKAFADGEMLRCHRDRH